MDRSDTYKRAVLVVEDEPLLRMMAVDSLEDAGFKVIEAANADDAIDILSRRSDIGVIFTDIQMPGSMDGIKLANAVRDRWPPVSIVITSGRIVGADLDLPEGAVFFSKPYNPDRVIACLDGFFSERT